MQGGYRFPSIFESPPECSRWPSVNFGELPRYPSMSNSLLKTWQTSSTWLISVPTINPMILFAKVNWKSFANLDSTVVMSVPNGHVMKSKVPRMLPMDVQRARQTQRLRHAFCAAPPVAPFLRGRAEPRKLRKPTVSSVEYTLPETNSSVSSLRIGAFLPQKEMNHLPSSNPSMFRVWVYVSFTEDNDYMLYVWSKTGYHLWNVNQTLGAAMPKKGASKHKL